MSQLVYNRKDNDERYYTQAQINIISANLTKDYTDKIDALTKKHNDEFTELKKYVSDGKALLAGTLTSLGVTTASTAEFSTINTNINTLATQKYNKGVSDTKKGTAGAAQVLTGYTFTNASSVNANGSMPNRGTLNWNPSSNTTYTVQAGYYSGGTLNSANAYNAGSSAARVGNATAAQVLDGKTFTNSSSSSNTGTMPNKGAWNGTITVNSSGTGSKTIPEGYHNGSGKVSVDVRAALQNKYNQGKEDGAGPAHNVSFPIFIEHDVGSNATYTCTVNLSNFALAGFKSATLNINDWQMGIGSSASNKYDKAALPSCMSKDSSGILTINLTKSNCPTNLYIYPTDNAGQYIGQKTFTFKK